MDGCVNVKSNVKRFYARIQGLTTVRKRKQDKRVLEIVSFHLLLQLLPSPFIPLTTQQ